jgi:hypothetical protein|tara:strand:+ start:6492 stop:7028 length:537 start_codon:yes stop_codon:yes gene_type:complete
MIHNIITAISSRVNSYIKNRLLINDDVVIVKNLVDLKGTVSDGVQNKISVFLLSVEEDKTSKNNSASRVINNPVITLNINIMFAAYFSNNSYVESLRYISLVIEFFQKNPNFHFSDTPGLLPSNPKLHVEIYNLNMPDTMRLWGAIGTKYLPSCAYRIKHVKFDSEQLNVDIPPIMGE